MRIWAEKIIKRPGRLLTRTGVPLMFGLRVYAHGAKGGDLLTQKTVYARVKDGRAVCPKCGALLGKLYLGAEAYGVELWCARCKGPRMLEVINKTDKGR